VESAIQSPLPPQQGVRTKPWGLPAIALALVVPLLLWGSSLGATIAGGGEGKLSDGEVAASFVFTIILDVVLIGIAAGLSIWRYKLPWSELGLRSFDRSYWWLPIAAAAGAHAAIIVYAALLHVVGATEPQQDLQGLFDNRAILPLAGVSVVLVAPLAEEIFFRGFIFAGLMRPLGATGAMLASGLLFGAFHITSAGTVGLMVPFGLIGAFFAWIYYRTGSLWPGICTHLLFNLVSFAALAATAGNG